MFKCSVTILLFLLVGVQTFSKWCLMAEFQINRNYIAKNLCINRDRPSCCCHGKCYLNKKMAADESDQQTPEKGGSREETLLQVHRSDFRLPDPAVSLIFFQHHTPYRIDTPQDPLLSFDQPPRA